MQTAVKLAATVLSGHRIELTVPELREGARVEVIVLQDEPSVLAPPVSYSADQQGVWDFVRSLPVMDRTPAEWAELDREFQAERNSWDA
jgi:hypothetical protein